MNQSQLQQMYANQNVRKMLDLIAEAEGVQHGYNTLFGNQRFNNLAMHPNVRKEFTQTDGRKNYTTAAGRYQFLNNTWNGLAKQYGFKDFSPQNQDLGAIALLAQNGALPYVLKGDFTTAVQKSGGTWASLPSSTYAQNKRGWDFVNKRLGGSAPQQKEYQPNLTSAEETLRLKGGAQAQIKLSSAEETRYLKNGYTPELASAEETTRLKGRG